MIDSFIYLSPNNSIITSSESEEEDEDETDSKPDQGPTIGPEDYTDFQVGA